MLKNDQYDLGILRKEIKGSEDLVCYSYAIWFGWVAAMELLIFLFLLIKLTVHWSTNGVIISNVMNIHCHGQKSW